jgi:carbon-monoxide dehydrogenase medium subunit
MFTYSAPTSVEEVLDHLARWGARARILAGGQTLIPLINSGQESPEHIVDINGVPTLDFVDLRDGLAIGACGRQDKIAVYLRTRKPHSLLGQALPLIADREVRARGTVCGSLAAALPGAELPAVALTCAARLHLRSKRGARDVCATSVYQPDGGTTMAPDEILTSAVFPECEDSRTAIQEIRYTQLSFAACGAAVLVKTGDRCCCLAHIAVFGQGIPAQRMSATESFVQNEEISTRMVEELAVFVRKEVRVNAVPGIPADYARYVAGTLAARAFTRALAPAELSPGEFHQSDANALHTTGVKR